MDSQPRLNNHSQLSLSHWKKKSQVPFPNLSWPKWIYLISLNQKCKNLAPGVWHCVFYRPPHQTNPPHLLLGHSVPHTNILSPLAQLCLQIQFFFRFPHLTICSGLAFWLSGTLPLFCPALTTVLGSEHHAPHFGATGSGNVGPTSWDVSYTISHTHKENRHLSSVYKEQYFIEHFLSRTNRVCRISAPSEMFGISIQLLIYCPIPLWLFPRTKPSCQIFPQYNKVLGHHCINNDLLLHNKLSKPLAA